MSYMRVSGLRVGLLINFNVRIIPHGLPLKTTTVMKGTTFRAFRVFRGSYFVSSCPRGVRLTSRHSASSSSSVS